MSSNWEFDRTQRDLDGLVLIEARNEAEAILLLVDRAPGSPVWMQLTGEEHAAIAAARDRLASVNLAEDSSAIRAATLTLDHATRRYAELQMDAAISTAIRGKIKGRII